MVQRRREQGLDTYIFFNDQEKAYDTTWRLAITHNSEKGVQGKLLRVIIVWPAHPHHRPC
jgi:hypothetical protein